MRTSAEKSIAYTEHSEKWARLQQKAQPVMWREVSLRSDHV